jgi:hypothetical protein
MRKKGTPAVIALIAVAALSGAAALGQQSDLSGSYFKTYVASTSGNDTEQTPTNSSGGVAGWRQIRSPLVGYEMSFSFNPEHETLAPAPGACGLLCRNKATELTVHDLEIAGDWIASANFGAVKPFVLGGLGVMVFAPSNGALDTNTVARVAYIGGGGADIRFQPRFGLRLQYRESFYKAPDLLPVYPSTGKYTQIGEPMAGIYIRLGPLPKAH